MKSSIGSTAGRSDISSRLCKRNRKPPACAPCRSKKLRCDRTLPSCTNCLSRPEIDHCDYTSTRWSRCGGRTCKSQKLFPPSASATASSSVPVPAQDPAQTQQLPTPTDDSELPDADADGDADAQAPDDDDAKSRTSETGDGSERASERTMREKLERLERMIASLMESKAAACYEKKQRRNQLAMASPTDQPAQPADDKMSSAAGSQRLGMQRGESSWSLLLNEKIHKWQQGLARYQTMGSSSSLADGQEKT